jgi:hypothetical protein
MLPELQATATSFAVWPARLDSPEVEFRSTDKGKVPIRKHRGTSRPFLWRPEVFHEFDSKPARGFFERFVGSR